MLLRSADTVSDLSAAIHVPLTAKKFGLNRASGSAGNGSIGRAITELSPCPGSPQEILAAPGCSRFSKTSSARAGARPKPDVTGCLLSLDCRARFVQTERVPRWFTAGWLVFLLLAAMVHAQDVRSKTDGPGPSALSPTLTTYCMGCHNARLRTGNLALDQFDPARVATAPDVWEKVARKLRTREMPPAGARRPDDDTYRRLVTSLESDLDAAAIATPRPGRVPVHRLNRTEYTNAIRDLLALDVDGRQLLADEPAGNGFDNVASVLTASPALIESYLSAASTVARLAVGDRSLGAVVDTFKVA